MSGLSKDVLDGLVNSNPLALLLLSNKEDIDYVNSLLPYSIGFEIECGDINIHSYPDEFRKIPFIMEVICDSYEKRFRIPPGINGIVCLYFISLNAKIYLTLNKDSGIHYHCDFSDVYDELQYRDMNKHHELHDEILRQLDSWEYKGNYNLRQYGGWFRRNALGTIEYRVGEMSFEYTLWIKRILHVTQLSTLIREELKLTKSDITYSTFNPKQFMDYQASLATTRGKTKPKENKPSPKQIINSRVTKL